MEDCVGNVLQGELTVHVKVSFNPLKRYGYKQGHFLALGLIIYRRFFPHITAHLGISQWCHLSTGDGLPLSFLLRQYTDGIYIEYDRISVVCLKGFKEFSYESGRIREIITG